MQTTARALGDRIAAEDGSGSAVAAIERTPAGLALPVTSRHLQSLSRGPVGLDAIELRLLDPVDQFA